VCYSGVALKLSSALAWDILLDVGRVIVVANQKGGVGKTTTVINLGAALAQRGHQVLMVDVDPQAALTACMGLDPYHLSPTTYSLLMRDEVEMGQVVQPLEERLFLAPASVDLAAADYLLTRFADRTQRLRKCLAGARDQMDFILIDTPPSLGLLTVNALTAADELIIPVGCQYLAMRGVRALMETVWLVQERLHPKLELLGLLPTMYQPNSIHGSEVVNRLRAVFDEQVFQTVIEVDEALVMAPAARKSVLDFRPDSAAAAAYRRLAEEVCQL
jgi:chromosome partitioning protein